MIFQYQNMIENHNISGEKIEGALKQILFGIVSWDFCKKANRNDKEVAILVVECKAWYSTEGFEVLIPICQNIQDI